LGSLSIITGTEAGCILLGKELDIVGSSIDIWKNGWIEHIDTGKQRMNNSIPG